MPFDLRVEKDAFGGGGSHFFVDGRGDFFVVIDVARDVNDPQGVRWRIVFYGSYDRRRHTKGYTKIGPVWGRNRGWFEQGREGIG